MHTAPRPALRTILASLVALVLLVSPMLVSPARAAAITADPGGPYTGVVGVAVQFDGTGSDPGTGNIKSYLWVFGDGQTGEGAKPTHRYEKAGVYVVALTVTDPKNTATAATKATIDPAQTTTTTTTTTAPTTTTASTTTSTSTSTTTTTTAPTTTSAPTTTTSTPPGTTTTTPATTSTSNTGTAPPAVTGATTTTLDVLGQRIEATTPAINVSATAFTVAPLAWLPGDEITVTLRLEAIVSGFSTVLFLLDGSQLGEPAKVTTGVESTFPRRLPDDLSIGQHRIELVTEEDPSRVLASRSVGVSPSAQSPALENGTPGSTDSDTSGFPLLPILLVLAITAVGTVAWRYRRRWLPRRTRT